MDSGEMIPIILGFVVSSIFFFSSFSFVDQDGVFTLGGFSLFIGGIAGYCITVYVTAKNL